MFETGAPLEAPTPVRSRVEGGFGEPQYLHYLVRLVATRKDRPLEQFAETVRANAERLYGWGDSKV